MWVEKQFQMIKLAGEAESVASTVSSISAEYRVLSSEW